MLITRAGQIVIRSIAAAVLVFLLAPSVVVYGLAFSSGTNLEFPPPGWSLRWFQSYWLSPDWQMATDRSVVVAITATITAVLVGGLAALGLSRSAQKMANLMSGLLVLPVVIPAIVLGLALFDLFAHARLIGNIGIVIISHALLGVPFVYVNTSASLRQFDFRLEQAARGLGASAARAVATVTIPAILPGLVTGAFFAFLVSWDELVITMLISGVSARTLPVVMFDGIRFDVDPTNSAVAAILTTTVIIVGVGRMAIGTWLGRRLRGRVADVLTSRTETGREMAMSKPVEVGT